MSLIKKTSFYKLFRFINEYFSGYSYSIMLLAVLNFLSSLLEGIGINAIIPLFSFLGGGAGSDDIISKTIKNVFLFLGIPFTLKYLLILIAALFFIKTIVFFISQYITLIIRSKYEEDSRNELLNLTLGGDWLYLAKQKIGHLEQALIMNIEMGSKFLISVSGLLLITANLLVYSLLAVNISPLITSLTLVFGLSIFYSFKPLFKRIREVARLTTKQYKNIAHYINEIILGVKVVKASAVEKQVSGRAGVSFAELKRLRVKYGSQNAMAASVLHLAPVFFILLIFTIFYKTNAFNFSSFAVIVYAINRVFVNFQNAQNEINSMLSMAPYLVAVQSYRQEALAHAEEAGGKKKFNFSDKLELKNVSFNYGSGLKTVSNINFTFKRGEMIGLIGPSGSGKTTIVDLFLRLLKPQQGGIYLDGVDIAEISLKEWRQKVGYVSQDIFLFNDTIANNIRFYDASLKQEEIIKAAKMANIYDYIMKLPEKFDTVVGERGVKLSGGQRQRVAIARVLAKQPEILILDEATSALDNESEMLVQKTIEKIKGQVTVLAIAHRLTTVVNFDKLIVLKDGRIKEEGKPEDLLKNKDSYFFKVFNIKK